MRSRGSCTPMGCKVGLTGRRIIILLAVFPAMTSGAVGQEVTSPQIIDPRPSYVVGFSELSSFELSPENRYIATSLPRLIVESLDADSLGFAHTYSAEEADSYAGKLIREQVDLARRALSSSVRQRDALLFDRAATDERIQRADDAVTEAREKLEALNRMEPAQVELADEKPVAFWDGLSLGRLLEPVGISGELAPDPESLQTIASSANLDLLIWGTLEEIASGYITVEFHAYSPNGGAASLERAGTTALTSDIGQEAEFVADEIAAAIVGRPWASVTVDTDVGDASIYVDGQLAGFGRASVRYLHPGDIPVEVTAPGYEKVQRTLSVGDRETAELDVVLQPVTARTVRVESAPADADVYVDSVWTGRTPISLTASDHPLVVRLRHDGYLESRFVLTTDSPDRIARALLPDTVVWADELAEKRGGFYRSLTWFVLSVPVTMILNGVYNSVLSAYPPDDGGELSPDNRISFARLGNITYWASWGSLLVNVGLAVNVGINLFDYLRVGEGAHNQ